MAAAMKHMNSSFAKLEKFEGVDFRIWQKKMHFMLSSISVVYVLTTPIPEDGGENPTVEQVRKRAKWDNDDYVCRGLIINVLEQYNKLLGILRRFTQHKMNMDESIQVSCIIDKLSPFWKDFKHTLKHLKEELTLIELGSHMRIKESLRVRNNDKRKGNNVAGPSVVNMVEHNNSSRMMMLRSGLSLEQLCILGHVHFKRMQDMSKDGLIPAIDMDTEKCKTYMLNKITKKPFQNVKCETKVLKLIHSDLCNLHATPSLRNKKYFVTFIDDVSLFCYVYLLHSKDEALDKFKIFKTEVELQQESLIKIFRTDKGVCYLLNKVPNKGNKITPCELWTKKKPNLNYLIVCGYKAAVSLPDPKLKTLDNRGHECIFFGYAEHSKAFRFSSVSRPSQRSLVNGTEDSGAINDEMDSIMGNNTWVLTDLPPCCKPLGCKWIFKRKLKVDRTIEKFKARLVIQGFKQKSKIDYFNTYAPVARISTIRLLIAMASIHSLIILQMDVKTTFLNVELEDEAPNQWHQKFDEVVLSNGYLLNQADKFQMDLTKEFLSLRFSIKDTGEADIILGIRIKHESNGKLSRYTSNPGTQHWQAIRRVLKYLKKTMDYRLVYSGYPSVLERYTDASWISNTKDNSSTIGWVFLLGGAAGKEVEWLKNLLFEFSLWVKPMAPISIRCDSAATLAKVYIKMYNGKSRHLGVRHSMIRELITNGGGIYRICEVATKPS
nr:hypothetical protein [Tanacetum cinerariifolium]